MVREDESDLKMYEVAWVRSGACVCRIYVEAGSESGAIKAAEAYLAENPRFDHRENTSVRVHLLRACQALHSAQIGS